MAKACGFTTVVLAADHPPLAAECLQQNVLGRAEAGKPIEAVVVLRNTGTLPGLRRKPSLPVPGRNWRTCPNACPPTWRRVRPPR